MTPQLTRLYLGQIGTGTTLYTATQRTVVRTIDLTLASAASDVLIKVNDTGGDSVNVVAHYVQGGTASVVNQDWYMESTLQWRGGLVLNPGDYLYVYVNSSSASWATVCGVVGV